MKKKIDVKEKNAQEAETSKILQLVTDLLDRVTDEQFLVEKLETRGNPKVSSSNGLIIYTGTYIFKWS